MGGAGSGRSLFWVIALAVVVLVFHRGGLSLGGSHAGPATTTVSASALPVEARDVLVLIDHGGPFPGDRDGIVFENRERLLPDEPVGYYHEYTVPTPGSSDRGARRIITGGAGELYWTDDHYRSFEEDHEISGLAGLLREQIRLIQPDILVTLGNFATKFVLKTETGITRLHGRPQQAGRFTVRPILHPAAAIYDRTKREALFADFEKLRESCSASLRRRLKWWQMRRARATWSWARRPAIRARSKRARPTRPNPAARRRLRGASTG